MVAFAKLLGDARARILRRASPRIDVMAFFSHILRPLDNATHEGLLDTDWQANLDVVDSIRAQEEK
jgi:hypothetical protein